MRRHEAGRILPALFALALLFSLHPRLALGQGAADQPGAAEGPAATLSLADCLKAALENNLDIVVRRYDPLKSETQVALQHATFDPLVTGTLTSSEEERRTILSFLGTGEFRSFDKIHSYRVTLDDPLILGGSYKLDVTADGSQALSTNIPSTDSFQTSWNVSFTQPLLRNLGPNVQRWQIVVARNTLQTGESQFRQTVIDTLAASEKAYWDLNFALMDLKTKRASLQLAKDFLEQNRIKVRVGTLAPIEITQAEAGVADREEGVILAENAVRTAEDDLRRIMNVPRDSPLWAQAIRPGDAPPLVEVSPDMPEAVAAAEAGRPDLEQARIGLRSRETELAYYRNQKRWGLDFTGSYGRRGFGGDFIPFVDTDGDLIADAFVLQSHGSYSDSLDDLRDRTQKSWNAMLTLSVPIGNRQAVANYTNAEYALTQARFDLQRLEQLARVEVRNAVRTVETNLKRVKAAQVNTRLQREKLAAEQKKFENGMSTSFQVLQFQTDLTSAESRENQAIVDYNKSLVELERVKGTLIQAKGMVVPGGETDGQGTEAARVSAALRGLWRAAAAGAPRESAYRVAAAGISERLTLPTSFVFDGRRLVGLGGSGPAAPAWDAAGEPASVPAAR